MDGYYEISPGYVPPQKVEEFKELLHKYLTEGPRHKIAIVGTTEGGFPQRIKRAETCKSCASWDFLQYENHIECEYCGRPIEKEKEKKPNPNIKPPKFEATYDPGFRPANRNVKSIFLPPSPPSYIEDMSVSLKDIHLKETHDQLIIDVEPEKSIRKILVVLWGISILLFLGVATLFAQTDEPFKFNPQTGKWETTREVVVTYTQDMHKLMIQDSIIIEQRKSIDSLRRGIDTLLMFTKVAEDRIESCQEVNRLKDRVIDGLMRPVELQVKEKKPFIKHIGIIPFIGTVYDFTEQLLREFQFTQLRYYGGVKWIWELVDKAIIDLRAEYPPKIKLEIGIKL